MDHQNDEATKRLLTLLMNRYDLRPSDAGALLAHIDAMVDEGLPTAAEVRGIMQSNQSK